MIDAERHLTADALQLEQLRHSPIAIGVRPVEVHRVGREVHKCRLMSDAACPKSRPAEFDDTFAREEARQVLLGQPLRKGQLFDAAACGTPNVIDDQPIGLIRDAEVRLTCLQWELL